MSVAMGSVCFSSNFLGQYSFFAGFRSETMGRYFSHVCATERRLVKHMVAEGLPWSQIQRIIGRSPDTIRCILKADSSASHEGGRAKLGARDVEKMLKVTESMVKSADAQKEIRMAMILRKAGYDVSPNTL